MRYGDNKLKLWYAHHNIPTIYIVISDTTYVVCKGVCVSTSSVRHWGTKVANFKIHEFEYNSREAKIKVFG